MPSQPDTPQNPSRVSVAAGMAALGGFLLGYDIGITSGAILYIRRSYDLTGLREGILMSAALCGAAVGAAAAGALTDGWGRRRALILAAAVYLVGALGAALAPSLPLLVAARLAVGMGIGLATLAAPLYIAEIAPIAQRGRLVAYTQIALACGIVSAYLVALALSGSANWRAMLGLAGLPAAALALGMWRMPASPRWLVARGRLPEAREVLHTLRNANDVGAELAEIRATLVPQGFWRDLMAPSLRPALIVGLGLAVFQQATGSNAVAYYTPTIVQAAGLSAAPAALLATLGISLVNLTMTVIAQRLVDRVGRRRLLLTSLAGMVVALVLLGAAFALPAPQATLALGGLVLYVGSFVLGLAPVFWLLIAEIYPLAVRARAMGLAAVLNWITSLLVTLTFVSLASALGRAGAFWLYAAVGVAAWLFSWRLAPETRGQSLEQLTRHWPATPTRRDP
ncbi:MAG: sugar porter family MFS transporter [Anaerolineae bacterium]